MGAARPKPPKERDSAGEDRSDNHSSVNGGHPPLIPPPLGKLGTHRQGAAKNRGVEKSVQDTLREHQLRAVLQPGVRVRVKHFVNLTG
ncbi:hypothetical protein ES705_14102 [subsurface metagenome]